jgi:hypothetical protein
MASQSFAITPPIVALEKSFLLEAVFLVEALSGDVVRPYLEDELVSGVLFGPPNAGFHQGGAHPAAPPLRVDHHPQFCDPPAYLNAEITDQPAAGLGQERRGVGIAHICLEAVPACGSVAGGLAGNPLALRRDRVVQPEP